MCLSRLRSHETSAPGVDEATQTVRPERVQKITDLMLFSMFAFAAHYSNRDLRDHEARHIPDGRQLDMGAEYAASARAVLGELHFTEIATLLNARRLCHGFTDTMYQSSRTSTCQALILLGIREFGVGRSLKTYCASRAALAHHLLSHVPGYLEVGWLHVGK